MRLRGKKPIFNIKDTWSLDSTLSPIIAGALKKFKEVSTMPKHKDWFGTPSSLCEGLTHEESTLLWAEIIDKMIYAFDSEEPEIPDGIYTMELFGKEVSKEVEDKREEFRQVEIKHYNKVSEGLELFGKYYQNLWW